jgi:hypothetical protein
VGQVRGGAPRDQSCARRERWDRRSFRAFARRGSGCRRSYARSGPLPLPPRGVQRGTGSVPPIYTKGDTIYYSDVVAGAPRDWSCTRCGLVEAQEGSGEVRRVRSAPTGHRIPARGETPGRAYDRCVLKERRIPPDSLACFAVAECQDWRWGSVPRQRLGVSAGKDSAGPVLRSQGTLGQEELSRLRADGDQDVDVPTLAPDRSRCRLVWATGSG